MLRVLISAVLVSADSLGKCAGDQEEVRTCHFAECKEELCIDCEWEEWSMWGPCECVGLHERHRTTKRSNTACGKPCVGARVETKSCSPACVLLPKDCALGDWSEWTPCDKTCGGGERSRNRSIRQDQVGDGKSCSGVLKDVSVCGGNSCLQPTLCMVSEWSEWSGCTKSCGNGQHERHRHVTQEADDGGQGCTEPLSELAGCNLDPCAGVVDCVWGDWVEWGACSASCGGGDHSRSRLIKVAPRNGGKLCEPLAMSEVVACQMEPCEAAVDCQFAQWTLWDACSCSCNGIQARGRHIERFPEQGGSPCSGALKEIRPCNTDSCGGAAPAPLHPEAKVDCKLSQWEHWQPCTKTCGGGIRSRSRTVIRPPANGGSPCKDYLEEVEGCAAEECKEAIFTPAPALQGELDCKWSNWDEWGACSASCGGGQKMRQRQITTMPNSKGVPCQTQASMEVSSCNTQGCECQDCTWGPWSEWAACSCTGIQEKHRSIQTHFNHCGKPCVGPKVTTKSCHPDCAKHPINCEWEPWSEWSDCSKECGGGHRERKRERGPHSQFGGVVCVGAARDVEACGRALCEDAIDCNMGNWHSWSRCSSKCGKGERYRTREIVVHPAYDGKSCEGDVSELEGCEESPCGVPVDCKWGTWSNFSACSATCGGGYKTRDRQIMQAPSHNGKLCEPLHKSESVPCNMRECNIAGCVDAEWGSWDDSFGECSASCGGGYQSRSRCIKVHGNHCGKSLSGEMTDYKSCNEHPCNNVLLDCAFGEWSTWGDCSCSCNGVQDRTRQISVYAQKGGIGCTGPTKQFEPCNVSTCIGGPVKDCLLNEWSDWETCSAKCGGGHQVRDRKIEQNAENGGKECAGYLREITPCNMHACGKRVDCEWGPWSDFGACSKDCDGGEQSRYRHIITTPKDNGASCQKVDNVEVKACNEIPCGQTQYCGWGRWTEWTPCSAVCGNGQQVRQRTLRVTQQKPPDVLATGVLEQMHDELLDLQGHFSFEHLIVVYMFGALSTTLLLTSAYYCVRNPSRANPGTALELELLQPPHHGED
eukprot:GEMP01006612.1.p1 GENE.GEMP01006612.1~~GEMP01006612.1.p1  ORF type:complete len:1075 (+),score=211.21 GEMP01006612.1:97-3225(+)